MPAFDNPNLYNYNAVVTPWETTGTGSNHTWEPILTELAQSYIPTLANTPLLELFPIENILERVVVMEQMVESVPTIFPLVHCGKPDVVLGGANRSSRRMMVQPLYIRRSAFLSFCEINSRVRPGTCNERWSPQEQINMTIEEMVKEHNLTWDVYRAMMLNGGIRYTDPRSGVGVDVSSQIPVWNFFDYKTDVGFQGRNESYVFRSVEDTMDEAQNNVGIPWTDYKSDIVHTVRTLAHWFMHTYKSNLTGMYMSSHLRAVISSNLLVKLAQVGNTGLLFNYRDQTIYADRPDFHFAGMIGLDSQGMLQSIAGIPIYTIETEYKDPVTGLETSVFPKNKVIFVSNQNSQGQTEPVGRTQFCVSEEMGGAPGLWTRMQTETAIPAAPGMYIQMGNAGLPYLRFPNRVLHVNVCDPEDVNRRLGLIGNHLFGNP